MKDTEIFRLSFYQSLNETACGDVHEFTAIDGTSWRVAAMWSTAPYIEVQRKNNLEFYYVVKLRLTIHDVGNTRTDWCTGRFSTNVRTLSLHRFDYEVLELKKKSLNITCKFTVTKMSTSQLQDSVKGKKASVGCQTDESSDFSLYFASLLNNGLFSDVTLVSCSKDIKAHKCILAARSSVFSKMFENSMKESLESKVYISDIETSVLEELVLFMYTGISREWKISMIIPLYEAADKYAVLELKKVCATLLKGALTVSNVMDILSIADAHNEQDLKSAAVDFINSRWEHVKTSDVWKSFLVENQALFVEILSSIVVKPL